MEENNQQKKNKLQQFYHHAQTSFFNIMFELLKEKKTSKLRPPSFIDNRIVWYILQKVRLDLAVHDWNWYNI